SGEIERERVAARSVGAQSEKGALQLLLWMDLQRWLASRRPAAAVRAPYDLLFAPRPRRPHRREAIAGGYGPP
ncbi:unnamed protein product, partial [Urochloa humidicola]